MKINFNITTVLSDGTPVSLTKYDIGGIISTVNSDGSTAIAPDGDYTFEDGSIATQVDGVITAIAPAPDSDSTSPASDASDMSAPAPDAPTEDAPATDTDSTSDSDLSTQIQALTAAISQLTDLLTSSTTDMKKEIATVNDKFNAVTTKSILETGKAEKKTETYNDKIKDRLKFLNGFTN